jgi:hypothetical protein
MDITPQQPDAGVGLGAVLREHHKSARQLDKARKALADYFWGNLPEVTRHLLTAISHQREAWRQETLKEYGYALERSTWTSSPEESIRSVDDARGFIALANHHATYRFIMKQWESFVQDGLSGERLQAAVCQSVIEAYRQHPGIAAKGMEVLEAGMPGFPRGLALSVYLTTHVAMHTSLHKNLRLRAGIDELRTDSESRFSRLLKELPAEILTAYRAREAGWGDLMDVRTEAVRHLEKYETRPQVQELAAFAERERDVAEKSSRGRTHPART